MNEPLRVVYIVGKGRSGSTLLDDVMGTLPCTTSTGELWTLWDFGFSPGYTCACGSPIGECPVWGPTVRRVVGEALAPDRLAAMSRLQQRVRSWPRVPTMLLGTRPRDAQLYAHRMGEIYAGVAEATGARTIIDSSKWPAHVGLLGMVPRVEPWLLHLVRDPRAVAHSYRRHRSHPGQPDLPRFGPVHSAASWLARNVTVEAVARKLPDSRRYVLRYEDFAARPRSAIGEVGAWLGIPDATRGFLDDRTVQLAETHLVGGNPRRFERGRILVSADQEWEETASPSATRIVTAMTAPLLPRYGYSVIGHRGNGS